MTRLRLDKLLQERALAPSREAARRLILDGHVRVAGIPQSKPGLAVAPEADIQLAAPPLPWVSRGALKLAHALDHWAMDPSGWHCLDVGASTGGFTDLLLCRGAAHVLAVDVGHGQLAEKLRHDPRVSSLEGVNARHLSRREVPHGVDLAVVDVSFISLTLILPSVLPLLHPEGSAILLIKPQFEAGREKVGKRGVVRDPAAREAAVARVASTIQGLGWEQHGVIPSPILGPEGNVEFLCYCRSMAGR